MFSVDKTTGLLTYESEFFHGSLGGLYRSIEWERRDVEIKDQAGKTVYSQANVETPSFWSQNAITIVASKYFRGHGAEREDSVFGLVGRVALAITHAGVDEYFAAGDAHRFQVDLSYVLLHQMAAFNSPVWFNVGTCKKPQSSACFILDVEDDMESILRWYHDEGLIFRGGSGSGINISKLREKNAKLSGGGFASGPLSFAGPADAIGGVIKSGGKTRRAAKLLCMDADHPDIEDFIEMKVEGEKVAQALIAAGFDPAFNAEGGAYALSPWQNANNSVRVTDTFMDAVAKDDFHALRSRVTGEPTKVVKARDLFRKIAEAAWACGDPGLQFDTTINEWHTCRHVDRIYASNPCCFTAETQVDTSEGRIGIGELARMDTAGEALPYAFSWDLETRLPVLRQIKRAWKAGATRKLVEITTDKGLALRCTPEHRWMTYGGRYIAAKDLKPGQRLRKINRDINEHRSNRRSIMHRETTGRPNGMSIQARFIWEQVHGAIPEGFDIHHLNEDPTDDRLSNLGLIAQFDHLSEHSTGESNPRFIDVPEEKLVEVWEAIEAIPRKKPVTVTPSRWNKYVRDHNLRGVVPLAGSPTYGGRIRGMHWSSFEKWVKEKQSGNNDAVETVRLIDVPLTDVFDIEVDGTNNFGIYDPAVNSTHSLIVHNSEYMFLNNTACNLASINLMKVDVELEDVGLMKLVPLLTVAMDIIVEMSGYPTPTIEREAKKYRTLGLGYANLGAYLMSQGLPYDSQAARLRAASITSELTALAYSTSVMLAQVKGPFEGFDYDSMHRVLKKHQSYDGLSAPWESLLEDFETTRGIRNAQATVIAPTGCVAPDTLVLTNRGLVPIVSLGDPNGAQEQPLEARVAQEASEAMASVFFINGEKDTLTVTTEDGYSITGTPNHRVRVIDKGGQYAWKMLGDMQAGDQLAIRVGDTKR